MSKAKVLTQSVIVPDILIAALNDREYAEGLCRRGGVMRHFGIKYSEMPYSQHYRDDKMGGERWDFRSLPFKEANK